MSSKTHQQHLTPQNLQMLGRVLDTAGVFDTRTAWHLERRMRAGKSLIASFQRGTTSEAELAKDLVEHLEVIHASCTPGRYSQGNEVDIARWDNEGGYLGRQEKLGGYRFGKRIESDGTWTIHHVFTGVPASYGTWDMAGLTKSVAERALRTINAPSSQTL